MDDDAPTVRRGPSKTKTGSTADRRSGVSIGQLPEPGGRLDSYELLETIGIGGMGAVYKALDLKLDRLVALKVLPLESSDDSEVVQRFYQEGRAAARLDHEAIARVFALGSDRGFHFIAFEYIEGTNLRQLVDRDGPMPVLELLDYALQVTGSLVHAAGRGVVHRDIKPSNIIITPEGQAKLVDMGLARRFERGGDDGLTQSGMTLGTFDYISPEQARDPRDVDVRSDLYSLGCTMYHMLSGRPPFAEGTVLQKLLQHQEEPPPDVRDLKPGVPQPVAQLIQTLMAKDRSRRHQTPEALGSDLVRILEDLGAKPARREGWTLPTKRWPRLARLAVVPIATAALISLGWLWPRPTVSDDSNRSPIETTHVEGEPTAKATPSTPGRWTERFQAEEKAKIDQAEPIETVQPQILGIETENELITALAEATPGSILELGRGPFVLQPGLKLDKAALTIRGMAGIRPLLRLERGPNPKRSVDAPLAFWQVSGGSLQFEGIDFEFEQDGERDEKVVGILAEDADLKISRCDFRRKPSWISIGRFVALEIRASGASDVTPPARVLTSSFEGALTGIVSRGPIDLRVSDSVFGLIGPVLRTDRGPLDRGTAGATLAFKHLTILAGDGPVFRLLGPAPKIRIDNSVIARGDERTGLLVVAEEPERLDWYGRDNLYAKIATYLQATTERAEFPDLKEFTAWADDPETPREFGSTAFDGHVWLDVRPGDRLNGPDAIRAFRLPSLSERSTKPGARQGPAGLSLIMGGPVPMALREANADLVASATPPADPDLPRFDPIVDPRPTEPIEGPEPVRTATDEIQNRDIGLSDLAEIGLETAIAVYHDLSWKTPPLSRPNDAAESSPVSEPILAGTTSEFLDAWKRLSPRGGTILLSAGADIELRPLEIRPEARWTFRSTAKADEARPVLRFEFPAEAYSPVGAIGNPIPGVLRVRDRAALACEGIDLKLQIDPKSADRRRSAFLLHPGSDLELKGCTVTFPGPKRASRSSLIALRPNDEESPDRELVGPAQNLRAASIRISDSILRGAEDGIEVSGGRRLTVRLENSLVALGGVFLRRAVPRGNPLDEATSLDLEFARMSCFVGGGLLDIESLPNDQRESVANVQIRESLVMLTDPKMPLLSTKGRRDTDGAPPIRWDASSVAYQGVNVFRQDQPGQENSPPEKLTRSGWEVEVGNSEDHAHFDPVQFALPLERGQAVWTITKEQARLAEEEQAASFGVDFSRLPAMAPITE